MELSKTKEILSVVDALPSNPIMSVNGVLTDSPRYTRDFMLHEYNLQEEAYGEAMGDSEAIRKKAAKDLVADRENTYIDVAQQALEEGVEPVKVQKFLQDAPRIDEDKAKGYALEQLAAEGEREEALEANEEVAAVDEANPYIQAGVFAEDFIAKRNILDTMYERAAAGILEQGTWKAVKDMSKRVLPFYDAYQKETAGLSEGLTVLPSTSKDKQRAIVQEAMNNLTTEEFAEFCESVDYLLTSSKNDVFTRADFWDNTRSYSTALDDAMQVLDFTGVGGLINKALKGPAGIAKAITSGNKTKAMYKITEALDKPVRTAEETAEVMSNAIVPTALNADVATTVQNYSSVARDVVDKAGAYKEAAEDFLNIYKVGEKSEAQVMKDFEAFAKDYTLKTNVDVFDVNYIAEPVKNTDIIKIKSGGVELAELNKRTRDIVVEIGTGRSGASHFVSPEAAEDYILNNTNLIKGEYNVVKDSEGYLVKARYRIPDSGAILEANKWERGGKPWLSTALGRTLFKRASMPKEAHAKAAIVVKSEVEARNILKDSLVTPYENLSKADKDVFEVLQKKSLNEEKWFTYDELVEAGASEDVARVYDGWHTFSDLEYGVANDRIRNSLMDQGYRMIKMGDKEFFGKVEALITVPERSTFLDIRANSFYSIGEMSKKRYQKLDQAGKIFIRRHITEDTEIDRPVKYYIVDKNMIESYELPTQVMEYVAGGRRYYAEGTIFAKTARTTKVKDATIVLRDRTIFADTNADRINTKVKEVNKALDIYEEYLAGKLTGQQAAAALNRTTSSNKYFRIANLSEMKKWIKSKENPAGLLDPSFRLETVADREETAAAKMLKRQGAFSLDDDVDDFADTLQDYVDAQGRSFFRRGEALRDANEDFTKTLSAKDILNKTVNRLVKEGIMEDYTKNFARNFKENFADVMLVDDLRRMSDVELLKNGRFVDIGGEAIDVATRRKIKAAENARMTWESVTRQPTKFDKMINTYARGLANYLGETSLMKKFGLFERGSDSYNNLIKYANPVDFIKAAAFHVYLGMYNIAQLWKQASGAVNVFALEPVHGGRAYLLYAPLRTALSTRSDKDLNILLKGVSSISGVNKEEFLEAYDVLKKIGAANTPGAYVAKSSGSVMSTSKFLNGSTFFFDEGERFNAITANTAAYLKWKSLNPGKAIDNKAIEWIAGYGDDLYLNMSRATESGIQKGGVVPTDLIAQFTSYPLNFLQAMFNKEFTVAQRSRLLMGNLALYGFSGTLGLNTYNWLTDKDVDPEVARVADRGLLNTILQDSGIDVQVNAGPEILSKIADIVKEGGITIDTIPGIQAAGVLLEPFKIASNFFYPATSSLDTDALIKYVAYESRLPAALRNSTKALLALSTGKYYTKNYDLLKDDVTSTEAIMYGLGFQPGTRQNVTDMMLALTDRRQVLKDIDADLTKLWKLYKDSNSAESMERFQVFYKGILEAYRDDPRMRKDIGENVHSMLKKYPLDMNKETLYHIYKEMGYDKYKDFQKLLKGDEQ